MWAFRASDRPTGQNAKFGVLYGWTTNRRLLVRSSRAEILGDLIRIDSGGAFGLIRYPGAGEKLVGYGKGRYD